MLRHWFLIVTLAYAIAVMPFGGAGLRPVAAQEDLFPTPQSQPSADPEVIALRAQLDEMRRSEDRLLQVIIGGLTVLALVNIAGYVVLNRNYDRDTSAMRQVLLGQISQEVAREQRELATSIANSTDENSQRMTEFEQRVTVHMVDELANFSKRARSGWEEAESAVRLTLDEIRAHMDRKQSQSETKFAELYGHFDESITELRYELKSLELHHAEDGYGKQSAAVEKLSLALSLKREWYAERSLSEVVEALKNENDYFFASDVAELTVLLEKVPKKYSMIVDEVRSLMRGKPTR